MGTFSSLEGNNHVIKNYKLREARVNCKWMDQLIKSHVILKLYT